MVNLERLFVSPITALNAVSVPSVELDADGFVWDRRYAIIEQTAAVESGSGESERQLIDPVRNPRLHDLETAYDLERETVTVSRSGTDEAQTFHLELDRSCFGSWLSDFLDHPVEIVRTDPVEIVRTDPDDESTGTNVARRARVAKTERRADGTEPTGPTVVSTGTLETVASWYDDLNGAEIRRRLGPSIVIDADPFWEDRLYDEPGRVVPFEVDSTTLQGVCPSRCDVSSTRDSGAAVETASVRETFAERRSTTLPEWASETWFDQDARAMVDTRVPPYSRGQRLSVGDPISIGDVVTDPAPIGRP